ncbi:MAG: TIGR04255 family protein [Candidatus Omnitrophica bacterium]|nr:TIGR04255 family protein [Candidatus Omnitrophota bacterium]MBU4478876.1 TIGR04255 family protein [Candidatus Omnitrophota bacterium]MCG2702970.1 TIGR04255 family protein [Candidatus Omnitrophota bacterium]
MTKPIDLKEKFPHLSKAPIVEAVIDFRVLPGDIWEPQKLKEAIIKELPSYAKKVDETKEFIYSLSMDGIQKKDEFGCIGYKLVSPDGYYIAQFNKQGFVLSRIKKYEDWDSFSSEALSLWTVYCRLVNPKKVKRIGVRFINHMVAAESPFDLRQYFNNPPEEKQVDNWNLARFLHQDCLIVSGTPYFANLIKTVIPSEPNKEGGIIVLDIDIFVNVDLECTWDNLSKHLTVMQEKKNKAFFLNVPKEKIREFI